MFHLVELALTGLCALAAYHVLRRRFAENLLVLLCLVPAYASAFVASISTDAITSRLVRNPVIRFPVDALAALAAFLFVSTVLLSRVRRDDKALVRRVAQTLRLTERKRLDKALCVLYLGGLWTVVWLVAFALVNVSAGLSPEFRSDLEKGSLLLSAILVSRPTPAGAPAPSSPPAQPVPAQGSGSAPEAGKAGIVGRMLAGAEGGLERAKETIADKTGTTAATERVEAIRVVSGVSAEEYEALVESNPPLERLVTNPSLQRLADDLSVLELARKAASGDMVALYKLGASPEVEAVIHDPALRESIREIDLLALKEQVLEERARASLPRPLDEVIRELYQKLAREKIVYVDVLYPSVARRSEPFLVRCFVGQRTLRTLTLSLNVAREDPQGGQQRLFDEGQSVVLEPSKIGLVSFEVRADESATYAFTLDLEAIDGRKKDGIRDIASETFSVKIVDAEVAGGAAKDLAEAYREIEQREKTLRERLVTLPNGSGVKRLADLEEKIRGRLGQAAGEILQVGDPSLFEALAADEKEFLEMYGRLFVLTETGPRVDLPADAADAEAQTQMALALKSLVLEEIRRGEILKVASEIGATVRQAQ